MCAWRIKVIKVDTKYFLEIHNASFFPLAKMVLRPAQAQYITSRRKCSNTLHWLARCFHGRVPCERLRAQLQTRTYGPKLWYGLSEAREQSYCFSRRPWLSRLKATLRLMSSCSWTRLGISARCWCPQLNSLRPEWSKMVDILGTTFAIGFPSMKLFVFWFKFHWYLFLCVQLTRIHHWFR